MKPWEEAARLERFRASIRESLGARFVLRWHAALIVAGSVVAGWIADVALYRAGVADMLHRYPAAIVVAYLAFLAGVRAWLGYSGIGEYLNARRAGEIAPEKGGPARPAPNESSALDWLDFGGNLVPEEGCLPVVLAVFVATIVLYAAGGYLIVHAGWFFAEIVLEVMLAAGLLRGLRAVESSGWVKGVVTTTWPALVAALALALGFAAWARRRFPGATSIPEVIRAWHGGA